MVLELPVVQLYLVVLVALESLAAQYCQLDLVVLELPVAQLYLGDLVALENQ